MKKHAITSIFLLAAMIALPSFAADALRDISLDFCDTTGNILQYTIEPWVKTGICYTVNNASTENITMKINFIDGTFTNDQRQNRACLDESAKENFGQYVTNYETIITLSGWETKTETARLLYPEGTDGQYHGCVTYSVVDTSSKTSTGENSNFSILMRKAKFIDVLVGHPEKITGGISFKIFSWDKNLSPNNKIRIYQDTADNKYVVELTIQNTSSIEQNVVITWIASNFLMYKNTFTETRKIVKGQEFIITKKLEDIPNYLLDVDVQLEYTPIITWIPNLVPQTSYIHETARIFVINIITRATLIGICIILLLIILLIRSSRRKKISWSPIIIPPVPTPGVPNISQPQPTQPQTPQPIA